MKSSLFFLFILISSLCSAQKYALIDKKMTLPVTFTNIVTVQDSYKGYFVIEKNELANFITEIEKIARLLMDTTKKKPETIDVNVGSTTIHGLKIPLAKEERMDVVLTTDYGASKMTMHLCDAKVSNASNAFFITTWVKYLRGYAK